jgi:hypothetical protein
MSLPYAQFIIGCRISKKKVFDRSDADPEWGSPDDDHRLKETLDKLGINCSSDFGSPERYVVGLEKYLVELDFGKHAVPTMPEICCNGKMTPNLVNVLTETKTALEQLDWWDEKTFGIWAYGSYV